VSNHALYGSNLFYVYHLSTAIFFIPFGLLNIRIASALWIFFKLLVISAGVLMLLSL
jgi:hypothetical protein